MRAVESNIPFGPQRIAFTRDGVNSLMAASVVLGAMFFNAVLAVVNAHVMPLASAHVMLAEGLLVVVAAFIVLRSWHESMMSAVVLIAGLFLFALLRGAATGEMEPKFFRDVLIIPLFLMLGLAFTKGSFARVVLVAHAAVFAVFVFEMLAPDAHTAMFQIQDYYINTRGLNLEEFYDTNSELFVSATRPDERFIPFIDAPRASSLFLEPVSLGNYCSIITAFTVALWHRLGRMARVLLPVTTALMIVGCDGRLALVTCAMIVATAPWVTSLPRRATLLYAPLLVLAAFALTYFAELRSGTDDFAGRLANTVEFLARLDVQDLLGLSNALVAPAVDSGITYLILTQSLPGVLLLWLFIAYSGADTTPEQVRYSHALCLYISLSILVSYAFLTIKTASLAWFIQGALQGRSILSSEVLPRPTSARSLKVSSR